jgi:putative SOS response-associated peptidase YedK
MFSTIPSYVLLDLETTGATPSYDRITEIALIRFEYGVETERCQTLVNPGASIPSLEWSLENGKKQPWYITRKANAPIFMAGLTNFRPDVEQTVETGFVIVTEDSGAGMVDVHDRRPVVLEPEDALRWMNPDTSVEEASHIAQIWSVPTEEFIWWKVDRSVNRADPNNNGKHLLAPISEKA